MKFIIVVVILLATSFIERESQRERVFDQLYGLEGKWIMKTKKGAIGEEWTKINNDYLQNRAYLVKGTDTVITERVALKNESNGIFYISTVENQNNKQPIAFKLTKSGNNEFVFENPEHDYPKRICYRLINNDSLYAWIDDGTGLPEKRSSFHYSRQK